MGKEVKIGLAVVAVLLAVFVAVVVVRVNNRDDVPLAVTEDRQQEDVADSTADPQPEPTVVGAAGHHASDVAPESVRPSWHQSGRNASPSRGSASDPATGEHRASYLPPAKRTTAPADESNDEYAAALAAADALHHQRGGADGVITLAEIDDHRTARRSRSGGADEAEFRARGPAGGQVAADPYAADPYGEDPYRDQRHAERGHGRTVDGGEVYDQPRYAHRPRGRDVDDNRYDGRYADTAANAQLVPVGGTARLQPSDSAASDGYNGHDGYDDHRRGGDRYGSPAPVRPSSHAEASAAAVRTPQRPAAERPANGKYVTGPNDTFWSISETFYGTGGYFKALVEYNRDRHPRPHSLRVGDEVLVPDVAELRVRFPSLCPKIRQIDTAGESALVATRQTAGTRVYVIEEGDTIYDIARYELGRASRWAEIIDLNRHVLGDDIDYLRPGMRLLLPAREASRGDRITRQPETPPLR